MRYFMKSTLYIRLFLYVLFLQFLLFAQKIPDQNGTEFKGKLNSRYSHYKKDMIVKYKAKLQKQNILNGQKVQDRDNQNTTSLSPISGSTGKEQQINLLIEKSKQNPDEVFTDASGQTWGQTSWGTLNPLPLSMR